MPITSLLSFYITSSISYIPTPTIYSFLLCFYCTLLCFHFIYFLLILCPLSDHFRPFPACCHTYHRRWPLDLTPLFNTSENFFSSHRPLLFPINTLQVVRINFLSHIEPENTVQLLLFSIACFAIFAHCITGLAQPIAHIYSL
jgi:hypothetical protein